MSVPEAPWFAGHTGALLVFRVNRRPMEPTLFTAPDLPADAFDHFGRVLAPGYEVITGRRYQRVWRVGGIHIHHVERILVGKLGWQPAEEEPVAEWSDAEKDWTSSMTTPKGGRIVPFGFDGETRLLTVLRDSKSWPDTMASVFERILRDNERQLGAPSTDWSVEAVLDIRDFRQWLSTLDTLMSVSFTAKLPNPEPSDAFADLYSRMDARRATSYSETLRSDLESGLVGIEDDRDIRQAIAMGEQGFAKLRGKGSRHGTTTEYSQANRTAKEPVEELPYDWPSTWALIRDYLKGPLRRFLDDPEQDGE